VEELLQLELCEGAVAPYLRKPPKDCCVDSGAVGSWGACGALPKKVGSSGQRTAAGIVMGTARHVGRKRT